MSSSHTHLWLKELLRISRPRFWIYVLGPMLLYFAWSGYLHNIYNRWWSISTIVEMGVFFIILGYFTLPANLRIYGWNDIADEDTDMLNDKKWAYEANIHIKGNAYKKALKKQIRLWNIGYVSIGFLVISIWILILWDRIITEHNNYILSFFTYIWEWIWYFKWSYTNFTKRFIVIAMPLLPFLLTSYLYSCKPLRAKAKPFIDGVMNILYIATPFTILFSSYILSKWSDYNLLDLTYSFFASLFRCMAMHCYSAIPDIEPDKQAWLRTTAVFLGKQNALIYCWLLYSTAAIVSYPLLWRASIAWGIIYLTMIIMSYTRKEIFWLYKVFPYINFVVGFGLFWVVVLK